jgi:hypothetical protein
MSNEITLQTLLKESKSQSDRIGTGEYYSWTFAKIFKFTLKFKHKII